MGDEVNLVQMLAAEPEDACDGDDGQRPNDADDGECEQIHCRRVPPKGHRLAAIWKARAGRELSEAEFIGRGEQDLEQVRTQRS